MKEVINQIFEYIELYSISEFRIEAKSNIMGDSLVVTWEQDYIRIEKHLFKNDDVHDRMKSQFELTENLLKLKK